MLITGKENVTIGGNETIIDYIVPMGYKLYVHLVKLSLVVGQPGECMIYINNIPRIYLSDTSLSKGQSIRFNPPEIFNSGTKISVEGYNKGASTSNIYACIHCTLEPVDTQTM